MVLKRESVTTRLAELDTVTHELRRYKNITAYELQTDLSQRWVIERGLIAAATLILDVAGQILVEEYSVHTETYEQSLSELRDHGAIDESLYEDIRGLGGSAIFWYISTRMWISSNCSKAIKRDYKHSLNMPGRS